MTKTPFSIRVLPALVAAVAVTAAASAQQRLKTEPGFARYQKLNDEISRMEERGALRVTWTREGKAFEYEQAGKKFSYDIANRTLHELPAAPAPTAVPASPERRKRGRQYSFALSPDGHHKAFHRDRNLWLSAPDGTREIQLTTEGNESTRIKYGAANWVYGEELNQSTAMWWSADSLQLAFYRFDESRLADYHLALDQTRIQTRLDMEPYMKAGTPNPQVDLFVYDLRTGRTQKVRVREGSFDDNPGHYVYGVEWSADGRELLFHRTNRRQNILELCAADPATGKTRVVVRESWPASWTENLPEKRFLKDGRRFIWRSERSGWSNFYLYSLDGGLLKTLTSHSLDVDRLQHVDESRGIFYYTARSGDNPMKLQLHRAHLDGSRDTRLSDPAYHHSIDFAPDGRHFIDIFQTHDSPPVTQLKTAPGALVAELARTDRTVFSELGVRPVEMLTFKAADGATELRGLLHYPANFDAGRQYPLLVSVYAGPGTAGARETFVFPNPVIGLGFFVATFDTRSTAGRGKRAMDAIYRRFGQLEIDDQAAAVRSLGSRPYIDLQRVGIYGLSYGGTASALCLLRYPDVFHAAAASSMVSDWRNYDSIYTERYMGQPQENEEGYRAASVLTYVDRLQGHLLISWGTADNNTHPANSLQLVQALQKAGKSFEVQVSPDLGHVAVNRERMMEFFIERLR